MSNAKIRLHLDQPLALGQSLELTRDQAHYLFGVMRLGSGDAVFIFNGRDGEWRAEVTAANRRDGTVVCTERTRDVQMPPDLWLLFAPIKKARTDFIVEKATELGVAHIQPVRTAFTNSERIRKDRLQMHAIEAAEQCGGTYVPTVCDLRPLGKVLDEWPTDRRLMWCDEHLAGLAAGFSNQGAGTQPGPGAILIGPEGGFSDAEQTRLRTLPFCVPVSLGPRILRADTAAIAAITLWQITFGDWK